MNTTLRPATALDRPGILATHLASLRELCAGDYAEPQLLAWASQLTPESASPAVDSPGFLVAERDAQVVGFAEWKAEGGEIVAIYVHPAQARLGLGTMLLHAIERQAREAGAPALVLTSTLTAVPFFARFGFIAASPTVRRLEDGTELSVVPMRKVF